MVTRPGVRRVVLSTAVRVVAVLLCLVGVAHKARAPESLPAVLETSLQTVPSGAGPVIVVDPGHSPSIHAIDPATGLDVSDYENDPEMGDTFAVALLVRTKLLAAGYRVVMTKNSATDRVTLAQRAAIANGAHATLALSIHDQAGASGGIAFNHGNDIVYFQSTGTYRQTAQGQKVYFTNSAVAALSRKYGQIFAAQRSRVQGHTMTLQGNVGYDLGSRGLAPGNIWMVQLLSQVPWIYNEAGGNSLGQSGLNSADRQRYADGLVASVEASIPPTRPALVWGVTSTGSVYRYAGNGNWTGIAGNFKEASVGDGGGLVVALNSSGRPYRYAGNGRWTTIGAVTLAHVSVGSASSGNLIMATTPDGRVYRYAGAGNWTRIAGTFAQVAVGEGGAVWALTSGGAVYRYAGQGSWTRIAGSFAQIAVGWSTKGDLVVATTAAGAVNVYAGKGTWTRIGSGFARTGVGESGDIWAVTPSGTPYRYAGRGTWTRIAGPALVSVSVGAQ